MVSVCFIEEKKKKESIMQKIFVVRYEMINVLGNNIISHVKLIKLIDCKFLSEFN